VWEICQIYGISKQQVSEPSQSFQPHRRCAPGLCKARGLGWLRGRGRLSHLVRQYRGRRTSLGRWVVSPVSRCPLPLAALVSPSLGGEGGGEADDELRREGGWLRENEEGGQMVYVSSLVLSPKRLTMAAFNQVEYPSL